MTRIRLHGEALLLLLAIQLGLSTRPFGSVRRRLSWLARATRREGDARSVDRSTIVDAVRRVDRHVPGDRTCLRRALCARVLLERYRHDARLLVGVTRRRDAGGSDGPLHAHAWVESDGEVLVGETPSRSELERLSPIW
jgi:hypothetical protein